MPGKTRLRNDLLCVEWDVKPYTLTHSLSHSYLYLWLLFIVSHHSDDMGFAAGLFHSINCFVLLKQRDFSGSVNIHIQHIRGFAGDVLRKSVFTLHNHRQCSSAALL